MSFKKHSTKFLKNVVEGTQKTLDYINVSKIAENVESVKIKAGNKLEEYKIKLEENLKNFEEPVSEVKVEPVDINTKKESLVTELNISAHTLKILHDHNIMTVNELKALRDEDLLDIKGLGQKTLEEIKAALAEFK
jgi:DNA-directed RNA polymerase alpha subunit